MHHRIRFRLSTLLLCGFALLIASCGSSPPVRFYLLAPGEHAPARTASTPSLAIDRVVLPDYLNRPQIAALRSANQIDYAEYDRWAEPLEDNIQRVLLLNLTQLLAPSRVELHPSPSGLRSDAVLNVSILAFDVSGTGDVRLHARWVVSGAVDGTMMAEGRFDQRGRAAAQGFQETARVMSDLLGALSEDIARRL